MVKTAPVARKMARILVIDDDPEVRDLIQRFLQTTGDSALLGTSGDEGLRQLSANEIDLVITDLYIPDKEGLETIAEVRMRSSSASDHRHFWHPAALERNLLFLLMRVSSALDLADSDESCSLQDPAELVRIYN